MCGFHQIELEKDSRDLTSFYVSNGCYIFTMLKDSTKFPPKNDDLLSFLYMNDLVVLGYSERYMLSNLKDFLNLCLKYNLKLNTEKCSFFMEEVTYLRQNYTDKGILPDDSKYSVIENSQTPNDADNAKWFVKYLIIFSEYSRHLRRLSKKMSAI